MYEHFITDNTKTNQMNIMNLIELIEFNEYDAILLSLFIFSWYKFTIR